MTVAVATEPKNLYQKLAEVVAAISHVEKRGTNTFQKYSYVKAADIANAVRGELSDRNIYLVSDVVETRNYTIPAKDGVMQAVDVRVSFTFIDGDSAKKDSVSFNAWGTGTDKGDKAVYKAMTGALKYGLRNAFLIPDELDPEGDEEHTTARPQAAPFVEPPRMNTAPAQQGSEPHISALPAAVGTVTANVKPTKEQLNGYKVRTAKIRAQLEDAGLQSSAGLSTGAKLGKYFARIAGVETPLDMSLAQWEAAFSVLDLLMKEPKQAVERIEETIK